MTVRAFILSEGSRFGGETGAGLMRNRCAFTPRDMAADWPDAFTYAIVSGWGEAMEEVAEAQEWDAELVAFLRDAHSRFDALPDRKETP